MTMKHCTIWNEVLCSLKVMFPVYKTNLNARTQIEHLFMFTKFLNVALTFEYAYNLEDLFRAIVMLIW